MRCRRGGFTVILLFLVIGTLIIRRILLHEKVSKIYDRFYVDNLEIAVKNNHYKCILPQIEVSVSPRTRKEKSIKCEGENWLNVSRGNLAISDECIAVHGEVHCSYAPIARVDDFLSRIENFKPIPRVFQLESDFFVVHCESSKGTSFNHIYSTIHYDPSLHLRYSENPLLKKALGFNVLMFGFDSVSRISWINELPRTYHYMKYVLQMDIFKGYNILGDGTPAALLPILTGKTEIELPEARRGFTKSGTVDNFPWIWKSYRKHGYVTQWGEDMQAFGTFQYRLNGFKHPPVDHYLRPFYLFIEKLYWKLKPFCLGSTPRHVNMMNWILDFFEMYEDPKRKFSFLFHSELSHDSHANFHEIDDDALNFLRSITERGYLNNTVLILFSDHGTRFGNKRMTYVGKLEERLPMLAIRMPYTFAKKYKVAAENLRANTKKLTTPFDVHETLRNILDFSDTFRPSRPGQYSLFDEIPESRSCQDAEIEQHWCTCLRWKKVRLPSNFQNILISFITKFLNDLIKDYERECKQLNIKSIIDVHELYPEEVMLRFVKSKDIHGRVPQFTNHSTALEHSFYQVTFDLNPGNGIFESTLYYNKNYKFFSMKASDISRVNAYGNQSSCISKINPKIEKFCVCREILQL